MFKLGFTNPLVFSAGFAVVVVMIIMLPLAWRRLNDRARRLSGERDPVEMGLLPSSRSVRSAMALLAISVLSALLASASPQLKGEGRLPVRSTVGMAWLLDCSQSILSQNAVSVDNPRYVFHPTQGRLGAMKQYLRDLLLSLEDGYTLLPILFAGDVAPMTVVTDYNLFLPYLREDNETISPYRFDFRGTDIAGAMETAMNLLSRFERFDRRVIVLLSDGDVEGGAALPTDIRAAAERARRQQFIVYTVLIGTPGVKARIPDRETPDGWYHSQIGDTQIVYSDPNPETLKTIASVAGNVSNFYLADSGKALGVALDSIISDVEVLSFKEVVVWRDATLLLIVVSATLFVASWLFWRRSSKEKI